MCGKCVFSILQIGCEDVGIKKLQLSTEKGGGKVRQAVAKVAKGCLHSSHGNFPHQMLNEGTKPGLFSSVSVSMSFHFILLPVSGWFFVPSTPPPLPGGRLWPASGPMRAGIVMRVRCIILVIPGKIPPHHQLGRVGNFWYFTHPNQPPWIIDEKLNCSWAQSNP